MPEREIRFAVVIYGGVSLAVYINGVAQELLRLVRATSGIPYADLRGSERVYYDLACRVGLPKKDTEGYRVTDPAPEPQTRFIVDVLSGTSAGGINAIYLAKALVNNQPLDSLARMWLDVADLDRLLNDKDSAEPPVEAQDPPPSLLNSRWMYLKLIQALDDMDRTGIGPPLVEDLDLYSTTTDLDGVVLPLALADRQVDEKRHRTVFHFRSRLDDRADFQLDINPFLAFAARCTSAFPFAFEPMELGDIFDTIRRLPAHFDKPYCRDDGAYWRHFFEDYAGNPDSAASPFQNRPFGDGGYLDNKPFSYAIDTVMKRHSQVPVDRKLIYIEPAPEDPRLSEKTRTGGADRPDAIENALDALTVLPRYETIREDLERILEWNRNVVRMNNAVERLVGKDLQGTAEILTNFAAYRQSIGFRFYLRLRRSTVTDRMAARMAEALDLDPKSAFGEALRALAGCWLKHVNQDPGHEGKERLNDDALFASYDLDYYYRAARYLRMRVVRHSAGAEGRRPEGPRMAEARDLVSRALRILAHLEDASLRDAVPADLRPYDKERKRDLEFITSPAFAAHVLSQRPITPPSIEGMTEMELHRLRVILGHDPEDLLQAGESGYALRMDWILVTWAPMIAQIEANLRILFELGPFIEGGEAVPEAKRAGMRLVRAYLDAAMNIVEPDYGWNHFDLRDSLTYPLTFGTNLGESDPIDVIRVSPADVMPIEGLPIEGGRQRLKGESLGAFGAFLDRRWRLNDMLMGRLHATERLITAVLPGAGASEVALRETLTKQAQESIIEEFTETYRDIIEQEERKRDAATANTRP